MKGRDTSALLHPVSRSQKKRDAESVAALATRLAALGPKLRARVPLPEEVQNAFAELDRISSRGAHKRHLAYAARLLRACDLDPVHAAIAACTGGSDSAKRLGRRVEAWSERIVAEGDVAVAAFADRYPRTDRRRLRQLARNAAAPDSPRTRRALGKLAVFLREVLGEAAEQP